MRIFAFLTTCLLGYCALTGGVTAATGIAPANTCREEAIPNVTFSVMTDEAYERIVALHAQDQADDNRVNLAAELYLSTIADLPQVPADDMGDLTFVIDRWFPLIHIEELAPAIRIFVWQHPLQNEAGVETNHSPDGPVVYLPKHGRAYSAPEVAEIMAEHVCGIRAELHGAHEA